MKHTNKELEPPQKVGRGTPAVETYDNATSNDGVMDDDSSSNCARREKSDGSQRVQAMLKPKKSIKIYTFNSRKLRFEELLESMSKNGIKIIGAQEHRRVSENDITFASKNSYHLITSTVWRNTQQAATGGGGIVLTLKAETFAGRNFRVFRVFGPFSRKFMPLEIPKQPNAKVFSREIIDFFKNAKVFSSVEKHYFHHI